MTRGRILGCLVSSVLGLAGCAGLGTPLESPSVRPRALTLQSANPFAVEFALEAEVYNPNPIGLPLEAVDYRVAIGGARAVSGEATLSATLPARGSTVLRVPIRLGTLDAALVGARLARGARDYRVEGDLRFRTSLGRLAVPIADEGTL